MSKKQTDTEKEMQEALENAINEISPMQTLSDMLPDMQTYLNKVTSELMPKPSKQDEISLGMTDNGEIVYNYNKINAYNAIEAQNEFDYVSKVSKARFETVTDVMRTTSAIMEERAIELLLCYKTTATDKTVSYRPILNRDDDTKYTLAKIKGNDIEKLAEVKSDFFYRRGKVSEKLTNWLKGLTAKKTNQELLELVDMLLNLISQVGIMQKKS